MLREVEQQYGGRKDDLLDLSVSKHIQGPGVAVCIPDHARAPTHLSPAVVSYTTFTVGTLNQTCGLRDGSEEQSSRCLHD